MRAAVLYEKRDGWVHSIVPRPVGSNRSTESTHSPAGCPSCTSAATALTATLKLAATRSGGTPYGAHALNVDPAYYSGTISWFDNGAKYAVHKDIRNDTASLKIEWLASEHTTPHFGHRL